MSKLAPNNGKLFHFPCEKPYSVQLELMQHVYNALASGQITVVESPTGTGKSLSLICSSLTWLMTSKEVEREKLIAEIRQKGIDEGEPDWIIEGDIKQSLKKLDQAELEMEKRLTVIRERENARNQMRGQGSRKRLKTTHQAESSQVGEDQFAPNEWGEDLEDNYSATVKRLLQNMSGIKEELEPTTQKVFYASRTHSQLTQFISEFRRTSFSLTSINDVPDGRPLRVIPLGSRQNLCINQCVRDSARGNSEVLNDLCLDLQKSKTNEEGEGRCPFLPRIDEHQRLKDFRDRALATVHDIEDLEDLGKRMKVCPYYGSREAINSAELVTMPYNMLMNKNTRQTMGITLENNVVLIDEAHNLIPTLLDQNSVSITLNNLTSLQKALDKYYSKFKTRFKGENAIYLRTLALFVSKLQICLKQWGVDQLEKNSNSLSSMMTVNELLALLKGALDQVNLIKLDQYLRQSKIAQKIGGYLDFLEEQDAGALSKTRRQLAHTATREFNRLQQLLVSLMKPTADGRVILSVDGSKSKTDPTVEIKYMLLAPAESFKDVASEAKSVVLAGGTMAPMSDFKTQLFPYVEEEKFTTFSCGHIVDPERVSTVVIPQGPTGRRFNFVFSNRNNLDLLDELGLCISNIVNLVPKGVVVFLPSKDFALQVKMRWATSGVLQRIDQKKRVFWEPEERSNVEPTLQEYSLANTGVSKGGIMFAVVDAKLSEGINFADDMARAVVIVGLPYPNRNSIEIQERMKYLDSGSTNTMGKTPGAIYYQNLAFRSINQSIGRAIRHQHDWASIILIDERYALSSNQALLPNWLGKDIKNTKTFAEVVRLLSRHSGKMRTTPV